MDENEKPLELALCESEHLVLRADRLYIFRVIPGCQRCEEIHACYAEQREKEQALKTNG